MRRIVMALDDEDAAHAIGPVMNDASVERIRDEIEERGWTNYGVVPYHSAAEFRSELRANRRRLARERAA